MKSVNFSWCFLHHFTALLFYCLEITLTSENRALFNNRKLSDLKNRFLFPSAYSLAITLFLYNLFQPQQVLFVFVLSALYVQSAEFWGSQFKSFYFQKPPGDAVDLPLCFCEGGHEMTLNIESFYYNSYFNIKLKNNL